MVLRTTLPGDVYERLIMSRAELIVMVRREFRSLTVAILPVEGDRAYPAGTWIRRVPLAIMP